LFTTRVFSQEIDTTKISVQYKSLGEHLINPNTTHRTDTSLDFYHQYNPIYKFDKFLTNTGNIGSPTLPLTYSPDQKISFDAGFHQFDEYNFTPLKSNFYNTFTPFVDFNYAQGPEELQKFEAVYTQNINPFWNIGLEYLSIISQGLYVDQSSKVKNFSITSNYRTPNNAYSVYFTAIRNRAEIHENGGIPNDSLFRAYKGRSRLGLQMEMSGPKNTYHQKTFSVFQSLNLNPKERDTVFPDTVLVRKIPEKSKLLYFIEHQVEYDDYYLRYEEDELKLNVDYYKGIYHDSFYASDRVKFREINNSVYLTLRNNSANDSVFFFGEPESNNSLLKPKILSTEILTTSHSNQK
jgi:hypothetical protein